MRNKVANLQQELDNSVAVQTDFVRLSQSLQMELEKIRQAEKEVIRKLHFPKFWRENEKFTNCRSAGSTRTTSAFVRTAATRSWAAPAAAPAASTTAATAAGSSARTA